MAELESIDLQEMLKGEIAFNAEFLQQPGLWVAQQALGAERVHSRKSRRQYDALLKFDVNSKPLPSVGKIRLLLAVNRLWFTLCPGGYKLHCVRSIEETLRRYDDVGLPSKQLVDKANKILEENHDDNSEKSGWARGVLELLKHKARMKVGATALSLEVYRLEHGAWPNALSDLKDEEEIFKDSFTRESLKYERTDSACTVYSVGKNQRDDGGERDHNVDGKDDIVFHLFNPRMRNRIPETPSGL